MSHYSSKTKFEPPVRDKRKQDQEPARLPPHKKPKVWGLIVEWSDTTTWRREKTFTSKSARDEARKRIERHFREKAEKEKNSKPRRYAYWGTSAFAEFSDQQVTTFKESPKFVETYFESTADSANEQ